MSKSRIHRSFKTSIYTQLARIGKATSSPRRLELLDLLRQAPRTVDQLARESGQSVANTSHHLLALRGHGLVESEKNGQYVTYRIAGAEVSRFFSALSALAESRLAEMERIAGRFLNCPEDGKAVDRPALLERVRKGTVLVLDVRPREEYEAGHLRGAVSVPLADLKRSLRKIPIRRPIVVYCRGPYCALAAEAVAILRAKGYRATRIDLGVPELRDMGFATESAARA